jgi:hypothetical protein
VTHAQRRTERTEATAMQRLGLGTKSCDTRTEEDGEDGGDGHAEVERDGAYELELAEEGERAVREDHVALLHGLLVEDVDGAHDHLEKGRDGGRKVEKGGEGWRRAQEAREEERRREKWSEGERRREKAREGERRREQAKEGDRRGEKARAGESRRKKAREGERRREKEITWPRTLTAKMGCASIVNVAA